ncbi:DUF1345 domain-containing protein [Propioniciclava soli]|uniref:DUF1345 domain-containing protein n=1 Tax=Propioniciclava soli TaxID=2775081 RepID=UPI001E34EBBB
MERSHAWPGSTAVRVGICVAIGAAVGLTTSALLGGHALWAPLLGWIATSATFCVWTWLVVRAMDADAMAEHASAEDTGRAAGATILLVACLASVVGVGFLLLASTTDSTGRVLDSLLGVAAVVASWFVVHMLFTLRYARQHVDDPEHGVDFEGDERPTYRDFAYTAYTIGMTYQVSDTGMKSTAIRRTVLRHALLSYFLGAVIIACTINLVVQLAASGS